MCGSSIARRLSSATLTIRATVLTIPSALLGINIGSQTIVGAYANVWLELAILLHREAIKASKVGGTMLGSALSSIVINATHLPRGEP